MHPHIPAKHYGRGFAPFESAAMRAWNLSPLDARALLIIVKRTGITCANLGAELWGRRAYVNCSCPWARPAGVVMKRLRLAALVEIDRKENVLTVYRPTRKVARLLVDVSDEGKGGGRR